MNTMTASPEMARLRNACLAIAALGVVAAFAAVIFVPQRSVATLSLLITGAVVGSLLVVQILPSAQRHQGDAATIPLSYAMSIVVAGAFRPLVAALCIAMIATLTTLARDRIGVAQPMRTLLRESAVGLGCIGTYQFAFNAFGGQEHLSVVLTALALTVASAVVLDAVCRSDWAFALVQTERGQRAWVAIGSSGMLMAVAERGVGGSGHMGIWGPMLFGIPLFAAWYSFERLDAIGRTHRQTIEALAMAPEFAGLVATGHAARVAELSCTMAARLGFSKPAIDTLETAALLHHLGSVTLDDPSLSGNPQPPTTVAHVTADMLRSIEALAPAGEVVARAGSRRSFTFLDARGHSAALVLQCANIYDESRHELRLDHDAAMQQVRDAARTVDERERSVIDALEFATSGMA